MFDHHNVYTNEGMMMRSRRRGENGRTIIVRLGKRMGNNIQKLTEIALTRLVYKYSGEGRKGGKEETHSGVFLRVEGGRLDDDHSSHSLGSTWCVSNMQSVLASGRQVCSSRCLPR